MIIEGLKKIKNNRIATAVITILVGILLVANPGGAITTIVRICGIFFLIDACIDIVGYFTDRTEFGFWYLLVGIVAAGAGIWMLVKPEAFATILPAIFGILMLYHGIVAISSAHPIRKIDPEAYRSGLFGGLISIILALFALLDGFGMLSIATIVIGIFLIVDGVGNLLVIHRVSKAAEKVQQEATESVKEETVVDAEYTDKK